MFNAKVAKVIAMTNGRDRGFSVHRVASTLEEVKRCITLTAANSERTMKFSFASPAIAEACEVILQQFGFQVELIPNLGNMTRKISW